MDASTFKKIVRWLQNSDICIYFSKKMSCRKKSWLNEEKRVKRWIVIVICRLLKIILGFQFLKKFWPSGNLPIRKTKKVIWRYKAALVPYIFLTKIIDIHCVLFYLFIILPSRSRNPFCKDKTRCVIYFFQLFYKAFETLSIRLLDNLLASHSYFFGKRKFFEVVFELKIIFLVRQENPLLEKNLQI